MRKYMTEHTPPDENHTNTLLRNLCAIHGKRVTLMVKGKLLHNKRIKNIAPNMYVDVQLARRIRGLREALY